MKKSKSRTINSKNNFITGVISHLIIMAMAFVCKTVFINTLGKPYLGINGLFHNIINLLSFTELGIGAAIIYNLYKPIAENDEKRIYVLMKFYRFAYRIIGFAVIGIGLVLLPFLPYMMKGNVPSFINVNLIFILYLLQSASSYFFFAYKSAIIRANQQAYIINRAYWWNTIILNTLQILSLIFITNFELYVALSIFTNIGMNIYVAHVSDKLFPFINKKSDDKLSWAETKDILRNCYALSLWKINALVNSSIDDIILSALAGLEIVGIYSVAQLIRDNIAKLLTTFFTSITASVGNLNVLEKERDHQIYSVINFITVVMFSISSLGFFFVVNPFLKIWLGDSFMLNIYAVLFFSIDIYLKGLSNLHSTFRNALGLFKYMKYRPLIGTLTNVILSFALAARYEIAGVVFATVVCNTILYFIMEPIIVYRYGFGIKTWEFYRKNLIFVLLVVLMGLGIYGVLSLFELKGIWQILVNGSLAVIVPLLVFPLLYWKSDEIKFIRDNMLHHLFKHFKKPTENA